MKITTNHGLKLYVAEITPEDALNLVTGGGTNRKPNLKAIARYAKDMASPGWVLNGEALIISKTGKLIDGQHRCLAAIEANVPFTSVVVEGVDDGAFDTLDDGMKRTLGQVLQMEGEENYNALAASLMPIWQFENGEGLLDPSAVPTKSEALRLLEHYPTIRGSVSHSNRCSALLPHAVGALIHHVANQHLSRAAVAEEFLENIGSGVNLSVDNPARALREILILNKARRHRLVRRALLALAILAWNKTYEGKPCRILKIPQGDSGTIKIPAFTGVAKMATAA